MNSLCNWRDTGTLQNISDISQEIVTAFYWLAVATLLQNIFMGEVSTAPYHCLKIAIRLLSDKAVRFLGHHNVNYGNQTLSQKVFNSNKM